MNKGLCREHRYVEESQMGRVFRQSPRVRFYKSKTLMQWSSYADKLMKFFLKVRRRLALKELRYCCVAARGNLVNCL